MRMFATVLSILPLLLGCSGTDINAFSDKKPPLVLEQYFLGKTQASGIFEDRFGRLRRQFVVDIDGSFDGKTLTLDERFLYADGEKQRRVWRIEKVGAGRYQGRADDIIGTATGIARGNALNWRYEMDLRIGDGSLRVTFDDWMYLQPTGVLLNRASVRKFGIEIGTVTLAFVRKND